MKKDLVGATHGFLIVLREGPPRKMEKYTKRRWWCSCCCGREVLVVQDYLCSGRVKSCGCKTKELSRLALLKIIPAGTTFERLTVLRYVPGKASGKYACLCSCGNITHVARTHLTAKHTRSCGCLAQDKARARCGENHPGWKGGPVPCKGEFALLHDHTGKTFGRLLAIRCSGRSPRGGGLWECLCDCGNRTHVTASALVSGATLSCGCLKNETSRARLLKHGLSATPIGRAYQAMRSRCNSKRGTTYKNYAGRGITICDRWESDIHAFVADVGEPPFIGAELNRIDNDLGYFPGNVEWTTGSMNARNTRSNRRFLYEGSLRPVVELVEISGMPYCTLWSRLNAGWSVEKAMTKPIRKDSRHE